MVDLGHALSDAQIEAFRLSDVVLLPVVADVPGLRRVRWALDTAESLGVSRERFHIVLNRYGGKNQVAKPKVEEALHASTLHDASPTTGRCCWRPGTRVCRRWRCRAAWRRPSVRW